MTCICGTHVTETLTEDLDEEGKVVRRTTTRTSTPVKCEMHSYTATHWTLTNGLNASYTYYVN